MSVFLGVDTSNYTTSVAVYNSVEGVVLQQRRPLPVKSGERGIRQSDAVFHHTVALPALMSDLFRETVLPTPAAIGASVKPRDVVGSYMPCFLAGVNAAQSAACVSGVPFYEFSHQAGHIAAAVYSAGKTALFHGEFLPYQVSGGTTELLLVRPDNERGFSVRVIGCSLTACRSGG
jgi:N6-L-threonylcarbamoyladenine synthase